MKPISLKEVVRYTRNHSSFYRNFWEKHGFLPNKDFKSNEDLKKIPILNKKDITSLSTSQRSTTGNQNYYFGTISSGTTMHPLVGLQEKYIRSPYHQFIEDLEPGSLSIFILRPPVYAFSFIGAGISGKIYKPGSIFTLGDINNLKFSAVLAREVEANRLIVRPSDAVRFARILSGQGYPPSHIKFLHLAGEPLTSAIISLLKSLYSSAVIFYTYGMTECHSYIGSRSSLCTVLEKVSPGAYHLNTRDFIFEIINDSFIITALGKMPLPLIRYDTGDQMIIKENFECSCGFPKGTIGIIGPRINQKSYKIGGFSFQTEPIAQALRNLPEFITDDFIMQIEQNEENGRLWNSLNFTVKPLYSPTSLTTNLITKILEEKMHLGSIRTLGGAIRRGFIKPIKISYDTNIVGQHILPPSEILKPFSQQ